MTTREPKLLARASSLRPGLADLAGESEAERRVPSAVAARLADAGMFRMLVPRALGGLEVPPTEMVSVLSELARGDAAAAWCVMTGCTTSLLAAYLPEETGRELWAANPKVITAGVFAPMGRAFPVEGGGYRLGGRWAFASGCQNASWIMGGALVLEGETPRPLSSGAPEIRSLIFSAADCEIVDTWRVAGLRGTGSHDVEVRDLFVPEARTTCIQRDAPRYDGPLYRFPVFGLLAAGVAAVGLGIARAAVDALVDLARAKKRGRRTLAEQDLVQLDVALAVAELGAGESFLLRSCEQAWEAAVQGDLTVAHRAAIRLAAAQATRASATVVDAMYRAGGGAALYETSPLQRNLRDIHAVTQHIMVARDVMKSAGRVLLGIPTDTSQL